MTEKRTLAKWFGTLLARLRRAEPLRPRWWHFAPHAVLVGAAAAASFFSDTDKLAGGALGLDGFCFMLLILLFYMFIPLSIFHALCRWLRSWSWRGAIWLLRPALLCLALFAIIGARDQGRIWNFKRQLHEYSEVIPLLRQRNKAPLRPGVEETVQLPEKYRTLTRDGTVKLVGTCRGLAIYFDQRRGPDIYIDGDPPPELRDGYWYDKHWYLVTWSIL